MSGAEREPIEGAQDAGQLATEDGSTPGAAAMWLRTVQALWWRDVVRFLRQRSRVMGALAQPLLFWGVIGTGLNESFKISGAEGVGYREYFFPGVVLMVVLFTSIFATISLIEDRHQGFLQAVQVAPAGTSAIVVGKTLGGATLAMGQAMLFVALAPLAGFSYASIAWGWLVPSLLLTSLALTALGFAVAWGLDSAQGYHAVMSVVLIPLWILSGAMFPGPATGPMAIVLKYNPMSHAATLIRRSFYGGDMPLGLGVAGSSLAQEMTVVAVSLMGCLALAAFVAAKKPSVTSKG
jgi:daunorubicin resistance ABC transporter membrane protein